MFIVHKIIYLLNLLAIAGLLGSYAATWVNPQTFWWFSLFGLAYPIILAVNLVFVLYWLLFKRFRALYSAVAIVLGAGHLFSFFQYNGSGEPLDENRRSYKVMTFNVRLFDLYNWKGNRKSRDRIFKLIQQEDPDVICFQEFFYQGMKAGFETRDTLVQFLRAKNVYEGYTHKLIQKQFFGLATFTAQPIIYRGTITFPNDHNNNAIYTDIKCGKDTVRIYNVHLASIRFQPADYDVWGEQKVPRNRNNVKHEQRILDRLKQAYMKRVEQTQIILEHAHRSPFPVMICGDFNDTPVSWCYSRFSASYTDAFTETGSGIGATYSGKLPGLRIDYIFHNEKIHTWNYKTIYRDLSDHYPVSCRMQVKK